MSQDHNKFEKMKDDCIKSLRLLKSSKLVAKETIFDALDDIAVDLDIMMEALADEIGSSKEDDDD